MLNVYKQLEDTLDLTVHFNLETKNSDPRIGCAPTTCVDYHAALVIVAAPPVPYLNI